MQNDNNNNNKNVIVGPDYTQLIKHQTNTAIIEAFVKFLFTKDIKFNLLTVCIMIRNMVILLLIKIVLGESQNYLDKFQFTNLNILRYMVQRIKFSEKKYQIVKVGDKWYHNNATMSISNLTLFLESKMVYPKQPATYYYGYLSYLLKIAVDNNSIVFCVPNIDAVLRYIENDVIRKNEENIMGGKTIISKISVTPSGILKMEPAQIIRAFPTENYVKLEEALRAYFLIDSFLKSSCVPYCINFDGQMGCGKTTFASYIATAGIFNRIIIYNLINSTTCNFMDSMNNLERQLATSAPRDKKYEDDKETVLIILDEIDKWMLSYIEHKINVLREEARTKNSAEKKTDGTSIITEVKKLSEQEEQEKRRHLHYEFLDQLYKLVDGHILSDTRKYVIIFNTNNFSVIFEKVDARYEALRDRFQKYIFVKNTKKDVVAYLKNITQLAIDTLASKSNNSNQSDDKYIAMLRHSIDYDPAILEKIPDSTKISYRSLIEILRKHCFNIKHTVQELCSMAESQ